MIGNLTSYSIRHFIPFTDEVYCRLFERQFEAWWPAHLLLLAVGGAVMVLAFLGKLRVVAILLGLMLAVCAATFHFRIYAELSPVGRVFGWAFLLQAALILLWGFVTKSGERLHPTVPVIAGAAIAAIGLAIYPLLALIGERGGPGAEILGMAPDPTICFAFGILLMCARPWWLLLLFPIPLLLAATTGATLAAIEAPMPMALPGLALTALTAAVWKAISNMMKGDKVDNES
jgi:hypothetical protein